MPAATSNAEWELPSLRTSIGLQDDFHFLSGDDQDTDTEFFDVKFYPYGRDEDDSIFAAISKKHVVIFRLSNKSNPPHELCQLIRDDDEDALNCSCTWTKDPNTEVPWLCIAGRDSKVKIYDVINAKLVNTLVGHGGEINDLATSPTNFRLIASASDDTTVRIWSIDPADADQPLVGLLAGEGHSSSLLTVAFHDCGRYVLSAGHDNVVCMWVIPELLPEDQPRQKSALPVVVHYPHFYTSEIHSGIVDCVAFFGDLILSRACHEDIIVLWQIDGFSSDDPVPTISEAPTTDQKDRLTRSAFVTSAAQYTRLLQFHTPGCDNQFYLRFKLFYDAGKHPVLAFGSARGEIFFWDLARLEGYHKYITQITTRNQQERPSWLEPKRQRGKAGGNAGSKPKDTIDEQGATDRVEQEGMAALYSKDTLNEWKLRYDIATVDDAIKAHQSHKFSSFKDFVGRQVAWSVSGEWCVLVGSKNLAIVLQRWEKKKDNNNNNNNNNNSQSQTPIQSAG